MFITSYLSKDLRPGKVNFSANDLLEMVQEMKLTHLPMFKGFDFIGNVAAEDLEELVHHEANLDDYTESFYLLEEQTIFDALRMMDLNATNVIPVLSKEFKYLGLVSEQSLIEGLAKFPFITEMAVTMIVSIATKDLTMGTISNIIESNHGKIYGLFIYNEVEDRTEVLIRFIAPNLVSIGETFERYGFTVIQKNYTDEKQELLQSRYAQLLKYMNT